MGGVHSAFFFFLSLDFVAATGVDDREAKSVFFNRRCLSWIRRWCLTYLKAMGCDPRRVSYHIYTLRFPTVAKNSYEVATEYLWLGVIITWELYQVASALGRLRTTILKSLLTPQVAIKKIWKIVCCAGEAQISLAHQFWVIFLNFWTHPWRAFGKKAATSECPCRFVSWWCKEQAVIGR